jgi:uncharacterized membrane protein YkoI
MNKPRMLVIGAVAATSLMAAATASAAADVSSVEVSTAGKRKVEVSVETLRGTGTVAPRVTVRIARRGAQLKTEDWDPSAGPSELVLSSGYVRSRAAAGATVTVRVRVCDVDCTTTTHTETVLAGDPSEYGSSSSEHVTTPLPAGAVTSAQASAAAVAANPGGTATKVERAHAANAAWEVKLLLASGARAEVLVAADGTIIAQKAEGGGDRGAIAPLPAGAVTAEQASAAALVAVPGTVREVERTDDAGAVWKVKVNATDGTRHCVLVAADGTIVRDSVKS